MKKIANIYKKNFNINTIGLRFLQYMGLMEDLICLYPRYLIKIKNGKTIDLFNNGNHFRDFTFVGDVSNIILKMIKKIDNKKLSNIYNICNGRSYNIKKIIKLIEKETNLKLKIKNKPFKMGDMFKTFGDSSRLKKVTKSKNLHPLKKELSIHCKKIFKKNYFLILIINIE